MADVGNVLRHDFADGLAGWVLHDPLAQRVRWLGREALLLGGGEPVLAPVRAEPPYTLRATVSGGAGECYVGCCFHVADLDNREMVYLAPQGSGDPTAIQYDPVLNASNTWQVFGDADGLAVLPPRRQPEHWHAFRLDVWAEIAQAYVDDEATPLATFPLRAGLRGGRVGLWGYLPAYVADFDLEPLTAPAPPPAASAAVPPRSPGS